ncbi:MAG TPA: hypothetical protein VHB20_12565 [Verrucomicrobiae bacterium]|jgi:hypothetical protein|nr:hypothetical protein [Verrucomicrobiae bacterium]
MKTNALCAALLLAAGSLIAADSTPKDDVLNAAKKLGASENYSWVTKVEMANFTPGPTEGKIQKDGLAYITYTFQDNTMTTIVKNGKGAIKTEDGWKSLEDAAKDDGGGGPNFTRFLAMRMQNFKAPADEASDLAGKTKSLAAADNVISGELTEDGVKALAAFGRRGRQGGTPPEVKDPKGSVKFWIKDGVLTKYEYKISGTREFNGEERPIDRTSTTEFKDVGTTKISVPDEAKGKMST